MNRMKFSVLMSVYFKEDPQYLKLSINSIVNQTILPNEIVIVKDGKLTKKLDEVIDTYSEKYKNLFKCIQLRENRGLGIALREGVKACSYDVIARMDSDDIAKKDRFEKQIKVLKEDNSIDVVGSYIKEFGGSVNNVLSIRRVPLSDREIKKYAKRRNPFNHVTVMYKKKVILDVGNYQPFLWNEDYYLWIRMILHGSKMHNIAESLVYARTGDNMFARRGGIRYARVDVDLQKEYLKLGFINIYEFITNIFIRTLVRIIPNKLRGWIYVNLLRNKE